MSFFIRKASVLEVRKNPDPKADRPYYITHNGRRLSNIFYRTEERAVETVEWIIADASAQNYLKNLHKNYLTIRRFVLTGVEIPK